MDNVADVEYLSSSKASEVTDKMRQRCAQFQMQILRKCKSKEKPPAVYYANRLEVDFICPFKIQNSLFEYFHVTETYYYRVSYLFIQMALALALSASSWLFALR